MNISFLRNKHLKDGRFILACTESALDTYEQAIRNGDTPFEAAEQANAVLFSGLHFSRYDTLKNILWNEFADEVPEETASDLAIQLLTECESVFANYSLTADFACEPEYELLYTELTDTIALYLESS